MLPFLKHKDDGVGVGEIAPIERKHDDDFDFVSAIADDMMMAFEKKDKGILKEALGALCEYIKEEDMEQDEQSEQEEG